MSKETITVPPATTLFFVVIPTVAVAFAVAALVPAPPRSIPAIVIFVFVAVFLRVSAWILYTVRVGSVNGRIGKTGTRATDTKNYGSLEKDDDDDDDDDDDGNDNIIENVEEQSHHSQDTSDVSSVELYNIIQQLMRPSLITIRLFHAASFTLIVFLSIRLFSVSNFGGKPCNLDYGPKISKNGKSSDTNIALETFDFDTVGHFMQGLFAASFSYPAVSGLLSKLVTLAIKCMKRTQRSDNDDKENDDNQAVILNVPNVPSLLIIQLLSTCLTYYPFYSMVKRMRYSVFSFAQTSHLNNTTEWCMGYMIGITLGNLVSALVQRQLIVLTNDCQDGRNIVAEALSKYHNNEKMTSHGWGKGSDYIEVIKGKCFLVVVNFLSIANLVLLSVTTLLTGIFFGLSWNYEDENTVNGAMLVIFICIFIVIYTVMFLLYRLV